MSKNPLHVWCVGYWEGGRFKVPGNLYHLKFRADTSFLFLAQISQRLPDWDWKLISERERIDLANNTRLDKCLAVCEDEIANFATKETIFNFEGGF